MGGGERFWSIFISPSCLCAPCASTGSIFSPNPLLGLRSCWRSSWGCWPPRGSRAAAPSCHLNLLGNSLIPRMLLDSDESKMQPTLFASGSLYIHAVCFLSLSLFSSAQFRAMFQRLGAGSPRGRRILSVGNLVRRRRLMVAQEGEA